MLAGVKRALCLLAGVLVLAGCDSGGSGGDPEAAKGAPKEVAAAVSALDAATRAGRCDEICDELFTPLGPVRARAAGTAPRCCARPPRTCGARACACSRSASKGDAAEARVRTRSAGERAGGRDDRAAPRARAATGSRACRRDRSRSWRAAQGRASARPRSRWRPLAGRPLISYPLEAMRQVCRGRWWSARRTRNCRRSGGRRALGRAGRAAPPAHGDRPRARAGADGGARLRRRHAVRDRRKRCEPWRSPRARRGGHQRRHPHARARPLPPIRAAAPPRGRRGRGAERRRSSAWRRPVELSEATSVNTPEELPPPRPASALEQQPHQRPGERDLPEPHARCRGWRRPAPRPAARRR